LRVVPTRRARAARVCGVAAGLCRGQRMYKDADILELQCPGPDWQYPGDRARTRGADIRYARGSFFGPRAPRPEQDWVRRGVPVAAATIR